MTITIPEQIRPLGEPGRQEWERLWTAGQQWLLPSRDIELVQLICEQVDERQSLRVRVLRDNDPSDRSALRTLDALLARTLTQVGFGTQ